MGKLLAVLCLCGLCAAALFLPVDGRSFWARAEERGLQRAVARSVAHGLKAGWSFVQSIGQEDHGSSGTPGTPPHSPGHRRASQAARAPAISGGRAQTTPPHAPPAARDGIVPQPPKERLGSDDRAALEKLLK